MKNFVICIILILSSFLTWGQDVQEAVVYRINGEEILVIGDAQKHSQYFEKVVEENIDTLYVKVKLIIKGFSLPLREETAEEFTSIVYDKEKKTIKLFKEERNPNEENDSFILSLFLLSLVLFALSFTKKNEQIGADKAYLMTAVLPLILSVGFSLVLIVPTLELLLFASFFILIMTSLLLLIGIKISNSTKFLKIIKIIKILIVIFYISAILVIIIL